MGQPFIGEIRMFAGNFAPLGWALCQGQLLQVSQNDGSFGLIGMTYGGDGQTTFALPDLRGRTPLHYGGQFSFAESGVEVTHTLTQNEMSQHQHVPMGNNAGATNPDPAGNFWSKGAASLYFTGQNLPNLVPMNAGAISEAGGAQAHNNMSPYLALNFCIALIGEYPSRA